MFVAKDLGVLQGARANFLASLTRWMGDHGS